MYPAQTITTDHEWTAEQCLDKLVQSKQTRTQAGQPNKQIVQNAGRRSLPKQQKQFKQQQQQEQRQPT